jgi:hypothetical protein
VASALLEGVHEHRRDPVPALIGSNPQSFDLTQHQRVVADRSNADAADGLTRSASDEKEAPRRQQLVSLQVGRFIEPAVTTSQFVKRGVIDAECAVRSNEFIIDDQI